MDGHGEEQALHRELFVRPSYRERANERWPYVIFPSAAVAVAHLLVSGLSGWNLLWGAINTAYGTTISAILLTLLVALVPGKPRPLSEASRNASGTRLGNPTGTQRESVPQTGGDGKAENGL